MAVLKNAGAKANAMAGIDWVLNPDINFNETDTTAAEMALGSGLSGSQFSGINNLRLRDSERMNRITLGNQLLNPYLEREQQATLHASGQAGEDRRLAVSGQQAMERLRLEQAGQLQLADSQERSRLNQLAQEGAQAMARLQLQESGETTRQGAALAGQQQTTQSQIAATAARDAIEQAGLDRRLGSESASRLQLAILQGDQNAQEALLREAGLNTRQREAAAADLERSRMESQNALLRTLIGAGGSGGGGSRGGGVSGTGVNNISTGAAGGTYSTPGGNQNIFGAPMSYNPAARPGSSTGTSSGGGGSTNRYNQYITQILRGYNLA